MSWLLHANDAVIAGTLFRLKIRKYDSSAIEKYWMENIFYLYVYFFSLSS